MQNLLTLETKKYEIKLENFEGPLDLLCHLIDKNKMDIYKVSISDITDQYIDYINQMEKLNLEVTSEFLIMASTLLQIKSRGLLPKTVEDEAEITEEELIRRVIEYKKYKEITKVLRQNFELYSNRFFRMPEKIQLPKQKLEKVYEMELIPKMYSELRERNNNKLNLNQEENMKKIALSETITIASKVKIILKELMRKPRIVFNQIFEANKNSNLDIVTAFMSLLELTRRNKVLAQQEEIFGDIIIEKNKNHKKED